MPAAADRTLTVFVVFINIDDSDATWVTVPWAAACALPDRGSRCVNA